MAADHVDFGHRIARAQGFDPAMPGVNWEAYGRLAEYRIGRGLGVPPPGPVTRAVSPKSAPRRPAEAAERPRRAVRIGAFELAFVDAPPAANRTQRRHHGGERTTGHYRRRHRWSLLREPDRSARRRGRR